MVQGRRGGRSARHFGPGPFLRAHDVPRHQDGAGRPVLPDHRASNGGEDNAFTTHDYTAFYEQIAKDRLPLAMELEADRMANLDLSDSNVRTERDVVLEERRMRVDNDPQALMSEQMEAALHLSHPYGRPVIGWPEEIRRIDRVAAQDFYDHHYAPNNAILVVAGDVTPDEVRAAGAAEYGKVPARELAPRAEFAEPPRLAETRMTIVRARREGAAVRAHLSRAELCPGQRRARPRRWRRWRRCWAATRPRVLYRDAGGAEEARHRCGRLL